MKKLIKKLLESLGYEILKIAQGEIVKSSRDLKKIFSYVYSHNVWGGSKGEFYSGPGSDENVIAPYIEVINGFIEKKEIKTVVDLGCGDFRVGNLIKKSNMDYIGVDIVPGLIKRNNKTFGAKNVKFLCLNAVDQILPVADLCLIRQVFQHLSNDNIKIILEKCKQYKYVIVSEHIPADNTVKPNIDMNSNWDIRLIQNSGIYIDKPPFCYEASVLLEVDPSHEGFSDSFIRTSLIEN